MVIIGIDPGKKGGIALIADKGEIIDVFEMPESIVHLKSMIHDHPVSHVSNKMCYIEKAQVMPKQGIVGAFTYGVGYGKLLAFLELEGIPYKEIRPVEWKKHFSLIKSSKEDSISVAKKLFPKLPAYTFTTDRGRKKDGNAEALLIAYYGRMVSKQ